ncbi:Yrb30p SCDLUD_000838 [Saccharomycodes ludwigii]|uniref:Yrb30p n=1 Tax=Saccharomycodes ludwigii TaxID=36035 RepID=UPI001E85C864|nr:hypothetical protein SCDLUD_000838 [Saccharomycodes ludwigii]KAH3903219.1 hypothetical protein SCDLUD_000838 [Saccharomycodes ludwigii]
MDQFINDAGSKAISFAIKSSVSYASSFALKKITKLLDDKINEKLLNPAVSAKKDSQAKVIDSVDDNTNFSGKYKNKNNNNEIYELKLLKNKLTIQFDIVANAMDLIKLVSLKSNTPTLNSTLRLIEPLQKDIQDFEIYLQQPNDNMDEVRVIIDKMKSFTRRIEEIIPLINLSLYTSGINLCTTMKISDVSPSLILNAAKYFSFENKKHTNNIGPIFEMSVFSVSSISDKILWKENMKRATITINKKENTEHSENMTKKCSKYQYDLTIKQNFDDGRYHNLNEEIVQTKKYDLNSLVKIYFNISGDLLNIPDFNDPVLVLKIKKEQNERHTDDSTYPTDDSNHEWIALGMYEEYEYSDSSSDLESQEESKNEHDETEDDNSSFKSVKSTLDPEEQDSVHTHPSVNGNNKGIMSVTLLEYILRLCKIQHLEQKSIFEINDEKLCFYLNEETGIVNDYKEQGKSVNSITSGITNLKI